MRVNAADFRHFFVLNDPNYYGQSLSHSQIKALYDNYRNLLTHNAAIAFGSAVVLDPRNTQLFPKHDDTLRVNLPAFHNRSIIAVEHFLRKGLAETSQVARHMSRSRKGL
jgi:hypothetical protein